MTEKVLGKITSAEYGMVHDYPFLFGIQLTFKLADGCGIGCGSRYTINISKECRWGKNERKEAITNSVDELYKILSDAKVNYVSELINKPVEVSIEKNTFKDFRILTEVL
ncbi:MAG: hypothetical protein ACI4XN_13825 [Candidatus Kurthia intestinigallinarum]